MEDVVLTMEDGTCMMTHLIRNSYLSDLLFSYILKFYVRNLGVLKIGKVNVR